MTYVLHWLLLEFQLQAQRLQVASLWLLLGSLLAWFALPSEQVLKLMFEEVQMLNGMGSALFKSIHEPCSLARNLIEVELTAKL